MILLALAILFLARGLWLPLAGRFLVVADPLQPADAVVPLGGGGVGRVAQAAALLEDGYATWLVATEAELDLPGIRVSHSELVRQEAQWQGVAAERILVAPGLVETTYEEALAVRALAQEQGWRSLLVVTDPFHTRRARLTFRAVFRGTGVGPYGRWRMRLTTPRPGGGARTACATPGRSTPSWRCTSWGTAKRSTPSSTAGRRQSAARCCRRLAWTTFGCRVADRTLGHGVDGWPAPRPKEQTSVR